MLFAQKTSRTAAQLRSLEHEHSEGTYITVPTSQQKLSPAFTLSSSRFFMTQVNVAGGANILGDAANEPSIAIDPNDSNRIAIGWRQFNTVADNFRQAGWGYSTNGGQTWTFPGVIEPGIFRSDPILEADANGNFYYNSLTTKRSNFSCDVYKSTNGGAAWDTGHQAWGGDKAWMVIDRTDTVGKGNIYSFWTPGVGPSICPTGSFTRSTDDDETYEACSIIPGSPFWGTMAIKNNGTLFIGAHGDTSFIVTKSTSARDSGATVTWDTLAPVNLDGDIVYGSAPNPGGIAGQTWIAIDNSSGPTKGNIYLLCSVQRKSTSDPLDVMFARSVDGGLTWGPPVRINDDTSSTAMQWFGTLAVAPNGRIDVIWLDTRDNPGTVMSSLYYSFSNDGGLSWSTNERLSGSFDPHVGWPQQNKMGDYFHMISENDGPRFAWAATFNNEQDVYFGRINESSGAVGGTRIIVAGGWNLLSVPVTVGNYAKATLFPTSTSSAFWFDGNAYAQQDTLANGLGYWLKFANPESVIVNGDPIASETVGVSAGWNLLGTISSSTQAANITSSPPGIVTSQFFGYNGQYFSSANLLPGRGYWVKTDQAGSLTISSSSAMQTAASIRIVQTSELPPVPPDRGPASGAPSVFRLEQNYPDPFNPSTKISFTLSHPSVVTITLYDILGRQAAVIMERKLMNEGTHEITFDAGNLASGIYFYHLSANGQPGSADGYSAENYTAVKKMVLLR
jgi:hypothetical protein